MSMVATAKPKSSSIAAKMETRHCDYDECRGAKNPNLQWRVLAGNTKEGSITVPLTSCLTGFESAVQLLTIFVLIAKLTNPNQSTECQRYSDTSPFIIPCFFCIPPYPPTRLPSHLTSSV